MVRFARRRQLADQLLHTHDTPRRTAGAFALGVFFGFSPLLGLHTILGLAFAFALRLNRVAVLIGVYSNLPWILPPYYVMATLVGAAILGVSVPPDLVSQLRQVLSGAGLAELRLLAGGLAPLFWSFMLGSTLGSCALAFVAYYGSLAMIEARRRHTHHFPKH
jgi:uncharacterized protein (DUF2062 family)